VIAGDATGPVRAVDIVISDYIQHAASLLVVPINGARRIASTDSPGTARAWIDRYGIEPARGAMRPDPAAPRM